MLDDCLTASEWSGNCGNTALCDREESINDTLSGYQRHIKRQLLYIRTSPSYRPFLHHGQFFVAVFCFNHSDHFFHGMFSGSNLFNSTFHAVGNHDLLLYNRRFLNGSQHISGLYLISHFCNRDKFPFLISLQGRNLYTSLQVVS